MWRFDIGGSFSNELPHREGAATWTRLESLKYTEMFALLAEQYSAAVSDSVRHTTGRPMSLQTTISMGEDGTQGLVASPYAYAPLTAQNIHTSRVNPPKEHLWF